MVQEINDSTISLNLSTVANGSYILKISNEFGVRQQRIVLQK
jgi:hypothetical protein